MGQVQSAFDPDNVSPPRSQYLTTETEQDESGGVQGTAVPVAVQPEPGLDYPAAGVVSA